jgi:hypothetical protein
MRSSAYLIATLVMGASPALAQDVGDITADPNPHMLPASPRSTNVASSAGQMAESATGQAGLRQTRDQVDGVNPMARIDNRIQNRVQARIRNRIDRNYDPRANATSPFEVADHATQSAGQRPR